MNMNWSMENLKLSKIFSNNCLCTIPVPIMKTIELKFSWSSGIFCMVAWTWMGTIMKIRKVSNIQWFYCFINACRRFAQSVSDLIEILILKLISDFEGKFHEERNVFSWKWNIINRENNKQTAWLLPF